MIFSLRAIPPLVLLIATIGVAVVSGIHAVQSPSAALVDYSISANPSTLNIQQSNSTTSTITLRSHNFPGTVFLSSVVVPQGPSASLNPTSVLLAPSGSNTSKLTVSTASNTPPGSYVVEVTSADTTGLITHEANVTVNVVAPDFAITASPTTLTVPANTTTSATVSVSSLDGFVGTVQLATISSPSALNVAVEPTNVQLSSGGVARSTLNVYTSCSTPVGVYSVQIVGAATSVGSHTVQANVTVQDSQRCHADFTLNLHPTSLNVTAGSSGRSNVTLTSLNGFAGNLAITATANPSTISASPTMSSVLIEPDATNSTTIVIDTSAATSGTYTVTVDATNGTLTHSSSLTVFVRSYSSPSPSPGPSSSLRFPSGSNELVLGNALVAAAVVLGVAAAVLVMRRLWPEKWAGMRTGF